MITKLVRLHEPISQSVANLATFYFLQQMYQIEQPIPQEFNLIPCLSKIAILSLIVTLMDESNSWDAYLLVKLLDF